MPDEGVFDDDHRELRLRIGVEARELLSAAVRRDALVFVNLLNDVMISSFEGVEISPAATEVPGPSYLQAFLAYSMRVAAAAIREAVDGDEAKVEDLMLRVCTALEIGDASS